MSSFLQKTERKCVHQYTNKATAEATNDGGNLTCRVTYDLRCMAYARITDQRSKPTSLARALSSYRTVGEEVTSRYRTLIGDASDQQAKLQTAAAQQSMDGWTDECMTG